MNGAKVKTAVILLLLTVNLVLGCVFGWRLASESRAEARAAADASAALERLGMSVSRELLSAEYPVLYTREEERSLENELNAARAFLGDFTPSPQGGGIYLAETERGKLRLSNAGIFELLLYPPYPQGVSAQSSAAELAAVAGLSAQFDRLAQMIGGVRVFGRDITAAETENGLLISGGLLLGEIYVSDGTYSKGLTAALLSLAGERSNDRSGVTETIVGVEPGYAAELLAENYTTLRPIWHITTDLGEYTVDAVTLAVMH